MIVAPVSGSTIESNHPYVEWDVTASACPAGTMGVKTFLEDNDETDDAGPGVGDVLIPQNLAFAFVIP